MAQQPSPSFGGNPLFDAVVRTTQDQPAVETAAQRLQPPIRRAFEANRVFKNFLHGTWVGHPLHPVITDVPIGAWTMAAIFDALSLANDPSWGRAADACVNVGIAGAVAAALSGLADWSDTYGRPARVGIVHAAINSVALSSYAASAVLRKRNRGAGIAAGFAGLGLAILGAGIGGHLVYGEGQGVNHAVAEDLPTHWSRLFPIDELIEDRPHRAQLDGKTLVVIRHDDAVYALLDRCAHLGGPLSEGTVEACSIRCPWHGSRFSLVNGIVQDGPATLNQPTFETRIVDGYVEVRAFEPQSP